MILLGVGVTLEPGHEGDHVFFRDGVEIACDAFAPVRDQANAKGRHCFTDFTDIDRALHLCRCMASELRDALNRGFR